MIYLIRHGETVWNLEKRKQGRLDSPLTLKGIQQAQSIANILGKTDEIEDLRDGQKTTWLSSPLFRAWQSCQIVSETLDIFNVIKDPLLSEHSFGLWEGMTESEIELKYPGEIKKREANWWNYQIPSGESYALLFERIGKLLLKYEESNNLVLFTHEMVSKMIRCKLLDLTSSEGLLLNHPQNIFYKIDKRKNIQTIEF